MTQSKLVTAPRKWKSATNHPEAHLAYITKEEQDLLIKKDLYNSLKGKPNRGPGGIPSLQGDMGRTGSRASNQQQGPGHPGGGYDPNRNQPKVTYKTGDRDQQDTGKGTVSTGDGVKTAATVYGVVKNPLVAAATWVGKKLFGPKKPKKPTVEDTAASEDAYKGMKSMSYYQDKFNPAPRNGGGNGPATTLLTQSVVTSPTADKAHKWDFKAYDNQQATTTPNVYNYAKAPYAKKGKLVRKYATGQEIKNFSKGKRFGPPPLRGPDPQGLQVILENSDYFKKLIG